MGELKTDNTDIVQKTYTLSRSPVETESVQTKSTATNILNSYKSYTYNFTMAVLPIEMASDPNTYRTNTTGNDPLAGYTILRSGGKGGQPFKAPDFATPENLLTAEFNADLPRYSSSENITNSDGTITETPRRSLGVNVESQQRLSLIKEGPGIVTDFNNSPWVNFDYYIDNVEIKTIMAPSRAAHTTIVQSISFDVYEPYSVSGFLETIQVASITAGYINYMQAVFLLRIKFLGYPDDQLDPGEPETVDKSTRYFPFHFTKLDVDVTEQGTRYHCQAVPMDQLALGQSNRLQRPIRIVGETVAEVLTNLMVSINNGIYADAKSGKEQIAGPNTNDTYAIEFPSIVNKKWDTTVPNTISKSKVARLFLQKSIFGFLDPKDAKSSNYKFDDEEGATYANTHVNPTDVAMVFPADANINEIIDSVIRDSDYLSSILSNDTLQVDSNDMIDFWKVTLKVEIGPYDFVWGKNSKKYTYRVAPHKIHYTQIPGFQQTNADPAKLQNLILRNYNYIYTGQNVDILNFKLNFNTLFYEPLARAMGNNQIIPSSESLVPGETAEQKKKAQTDLESIQRKFIGRPVTLPDGFASKLNQKNAGIPSKDPFAIQAKNMFNSLLSNSQYSMLKGDLEIIGDPFYLVTGGLGNYFPDQNELTPAETVDGEVNHNYSQVLIEVDFKNPVDIDDRSLSTNGTGMAIFDNKKVSFTGIYMVTQATSVFREGVFKQHLNLIRMVAVDVDPKIKVIPIEQVMESNPNPYDKSVPDAGKEKIVKTPSSILNLIKGIQTVEGSIQNAINTINNKINGGISAAQAELNSVMNTIKAEISPVTSTISDITSKIQGASSALSNAATKLGLTPGQTASLSLLQIQTMVKIAQSLPQNSNLSQSLANGLVLTSAASLSNIPPAQPATIAPPTGQTINGKYYTFEQIQANKDASDASGIPLSAYYGISSSQSTGKGL